MSDSIRDFQSAMRARGLEPPSQIVPGKLHRFPGAGKRVGNTAGWFKFFEDCNGGVFGDFSQDLSEHWRADRSTPLSPSQLEEWSCQIQETKAQVDADKIAKESEAAKRATAVWLAAEPATDDHPYLARKGIKSNGAKVHNGKLVVPVFEGACCVRFNLSEQMA